MPSAVLQALARHLRRSDAQQPAPRRPRPPPIARATASGRATPAAAAGAAAKPLSGVRVVDLTHVLAGPYCTYQLGLMGAEVIKIEPPGGEGERGDTVAGGYATQGGAKRHGTADLKQQGGLELVKKLVATADIFVENFRPGVAERLGLGFAALSALTQKLVYTSLSAFGAVGPFGGRPAFDHVVQAHTGIMSTTGPEGSGPTKVGAPYVSAATAGLGGGCCRLTVDRGCQQFGPSQLSADQQLIQWDNFAGRWDGNLPFADDAAYLRRR